MRAGLSQGERKAAVAGPPTSRVCRGTGPADNANSEGSTSLRGCLPALWSKRRQGVCTDETPVALARSREEFLASASVGVVCKQVTREAVTRLLAAHNVSEEGVKVVNRVVDGQRVREPKSSMFSSLVAHVSPKMREVVTCESATVEYLFALQQDHDPDVLGYFSRPCELELCYQGRTRVQRDFSAPDFLVLTPSFVGFYECKSRQWLEREARRCSKRWCWDEERGWHSPPGEEAAARLGLGYRVWTPELSSAVFLENAEFLHDFLRVDAPAVSEATRELVRSVVSECPGLTLREALDQIGDSDALYTLIARREVYVDLARFRLCELQAVRLFNDRGAARTWSRALDTAPGVHEGYPESARLSESASAQLRLMPRSVDATVLARYELLLPAIEGRVPLRKLVGPGGRDPSLSALKRWMRGYRTAQREFGCGLIGLESREHLRGSRVSVLGRTLLDLMEEVASTHYDDVRGQTKKAVHLELCGRVEGTPALRGLPPPHYATFARFLDGRPRFQTKKMREGIRAALAERGLVYDNDETWTRHRMRPLGVVHADHTLLDLWLVLEVGRKRMPHRCKVWLSIAVCAWSGVVLGYYLSFNAPSYASVMGLMRDVVRRHKRMPALMVVDNAKEFVSDAMRKFAAAYGMTLRLRPKGQPKYGAPVETLFNVANKVFVHNLLGNNKLLQRPRAMSKEVDPRGHAVYRFGAFDRALSRFFFEVYNAHSNEEGLESPDERLERGFRETGERAHVQVVCDAKFVALTLPYHSRTPKVHRRTGIRVAGFDYSSLRLEAVVGTEVKVKVDPDSVGYVLAEVGGEWVECRSRLYREFLSFSVREVRLLSAQMRAGALRGLPSGMRDAAMLVLLRDARGYEEAQLQRARDEARRSADASAVHGCEAHAQLERPVGAPAADVEPSGEDADSSVCWDRPPLEELS